MCWKGKASNYQEIFEYIDKSNDNELKEFEARLEETSLVNYNVYICRFKKRMTFAETSKKLDIPTNRIGDFVAEVALAFEIFFDIHG